MYSILWYMRSFAQGPGNRQRTTIRPVLLLLRVTVWHRHEKFYSRLMITSTYWSTSVVYESFCNYAASLLRVLGGVGVLLLFETFILLLKRNPVTKRKLSFVHGSHLQNPISVLPFSLSLSPPLPPLSSFLQRSLKTKQNEKNTLIKKVLTFSGPLPVSRRTLCWTGGRGKGD